MKYLKLFEQMEISDESAAQKIFNKIKGTPNLKVSLIESLVIKYLSMVGKSKSDVKHLTALVIDLLELFDF
jgi:hypothetical protein